MRSNLLVWIILLLLIIILQSFGAPFLSGIFLGNFILVFLLTLVSFLKKEWSAAWKIFLLTGIMADLFFMYPLGLSALFFLILGALFYFLREKFLAFEDKNFFYPLMLLIVAIISFGQLFLMLIIFLGHFFQLDSFRAINIPFDLSFFFSNLLSSWIFYAVSYYVIKKIKPLLITTPSTLIIQR